MTYEVLHECTHNIIEEVLIVLSVYFRSDLVHDLINPLDSFLLPTN